MRGRVFFGILIICIGVVFLLSVLNVIPFSFGVWWPLILIVLAIPGIIVGPGRLFSLLMLYVGAWFLCRNLNVLPDNLWGAFWAGAIILFGIGVLFGFQRRWHKPREEKNAQFECHSEFGETNRKNTSEAFTSGKASAVFGSVKLDLTTAQAGAPEVNLTLDAVFGNVEVTVPREWEVRIKGSIVVGSIDDRTIKDPGMKKAVLLANCSGFMGNITIRN